MNTDLNKITEFPLGANIKTSLLDFGGNKEIKYFISENARNPTLGGKNFGFPNEKLLETIKVLLNIIPTNFGVEIIYKVTDSRTSAVTNSVLPTDDIFKEVWSIVDGKIELLRVEKGTYVPPKQGSYEFQ